MALDTVLLVVVWLCLVLVGLLGVLVLKHLAAIEGLLAQPRLVVMPPAEAPRVVVAPRPSAPNPGLSCHCGHTHQTVHTLADGTTVCDDCHVG